MRVVDREAHERGLARVVSEVADPAVGINPVGSESRRVGRESLAFVGAGRAVLLQLAHPCVAQAIAEHSTTVADVAGRFHRTFASVTQMAFGPLDEVLRTARQVHRIHSRVRGSIQGDVGAFRRGTPYHANDEATLLWVYATLVDTTVHLHLQCGRLTPSQCEPYYQQTKVFAALFGIQEATLPTDWMAFSRYMAEMLASDVIAVSQPAREMAAFLMRAPAWPLKPAYALYKLITAGLLPERLRHDFGLPFAARQARIWGVSMATLKHVYPRIPAALRYLPAYVQAERRRSGRPPSRLSAAVERWILYAVAGGKPKSRRP